MLFQALATSSREAWKSLLLIDRSFVRNVRRNDPTGDPCKTSLIPESIHDNQSFNVVQLLAFFVERSESLLFCDIQLGALRLVRCSNSCSDGIGARVEILSCIVPRVLLKKNTRNEPMNMRKQPSFENGFDGCPHPLKTSSPNIVRISMLEK